MLSCLVAPEALDHVSVPGVRRPPKINTDARSLVQQRIGTEGGLLDLECEEVSRLRCPLECARRPVDNVGHDGLLLLLLELCGPLRFLA